MSIIEQLDPVSFSNYLKKYHNTICGRHPIGVLLNVSNFLLENVTFSKMLVFILKTKLLEHSLVLKWEVMNESFFFFFKCSEFGLPFHCLAYRQT